MRSELAPLSEYSERTKLSKPEKCRKKKRQRQSVIDEDKYNIEDDENTFSNNDQNDNGASNGHHNVSYDKIEPADHVQSQPYGPD